MCVCREREEMIRIQGSKRERWFVSGGAEKDKGKKKKKQSRILSSYSNPSIYIYLKDMDPE